MRYTAAIIAISLLGFALRLFTALTHDGYLGVDGGAYLLSLLDVQGKETTGTDFPRPPLAHGWLLWPFVELWGTNTGLKLFHVAATIPLIPAFYLFARLWLRNWQLVVAIALLVFDMALAEQFIAGPLPQLGYAVIFTSLWAMSRHVESHKLQHGFLLLLAIPLLAFVNQTTTAIAAFMLSAYWLGLTYQNGWRRTWRIPVFGFAGLVAALVMAWPWYIAVTPGGEYTRYPGPLITNYIWPNPAYLQSFIGLVGAIAAWRIGGQWRVFAPLLLVMATLAVLYSYDESLQNIFYRTRYIVPMTAAIPLIVVISRQLRPGAYWRAAMVPLALWLALAVPSAYLYTLVVDTQIEQMVNEDTEAVIEAMNRADTSGGVVVNSYSLALYVAALTQQSVAWSQVYIPPPKYVDQHEHTVCLFGWRECSPQRAAEELGVKWILVNKEWPVRKAELGETLTGLPSVYDTLAQTSADYSSASYGKILGAPDETPWQVTEQEATWLIPITHAGNTTLWAIER